MLGEGKIKTISQFGFLWPFVFLLQHFACINFLGERKEEKFVCLSKLNEISRWLLLSESLGNHRINHIWISVFYMLTSRSTFSISHRSHAGTLIFGEKTTFPAIIKPSNHIENCSQSWHKHKSPFDQIQFSFIGCPRSSERVHKSACLGLVKDSLAPTTSRKLFNVKTLKNKKFPTCFRIDGATKSA